MQNKQTNKIEPSPRPNLDKSNRPLLQEIESNGSHKTAALEPTMDPEISQLKLAVNNEKKLEPKTPLYPLIDVPRETIRQKFAKNKNALDSSKKYMQQLQQKINLNQMYELIETCNNNYNSSFAPVLLLIKEQQLFENNRPYLLQVWSTMGTNGGVLVFERQLQKPPTQWAISGNVFLFRESEDADEVFVLKLRVKRPATLYKVALPFSDLVILHKKVDDPQPNITLGYTNGHILIGLTRKILYADVDNILTSQDKNEAEKEEREENEFDAQKLCRFGKLELEHFKAINVAADFSTLAFLDVSDEGYKIDKKEEAKDRTIVAAVFESSYDHRLIFHKITFKKTQNFVEVDLADLANNAEKPLMKEPDAAEISAGIEKWFTVTQTNYKGETSNITLVLQKNKSVDFYFNFVLVETTPAALKFRDINFDKNYIYLSEEKNATTNNYFIHRIAQSWRKRIGMTVPETITEDTIEGVLHKMDGILSKRVSNFMRLYRSQMSFENFFVVGHRRFVSAYHLVTEVWTHFKFDDNVQYIGQMISTKKKEKTKNRAYSWNFSDKYELAVFVGSSTIRFLTVDAINKTLGLQEETLNANGVFRRIVRDQIKHHGVTVLLSDAPKRDIYVIPEQDQTVCFSTLIMNESTDSTLFSLAFLTERKLMPLLDQKAATANHKEAEEMLSNKCKFFQYLDFWPDQGRKDKDQEEQSHPTKLRKMLGVFNPVNGKFKSYLLKFSRIYDKEQNKKKFKCDFQGCKISNNPDIELDLKEHVSESGSVRGLFKILETDNVNSDFLIVTDSKFLVFGADKNLKFIYNGFHVGSVMQADQFFLYSINDQEYEHELYKVNKEEDDELIYSDQFFKSQGLYIYNLTGLLKGRIESYKLASALAGGFELQFSNFDLNMCLFPNFTNVMMIPYVHRNTITFKGIQQKNNYLIWREKSGYFSAMTTAGKIATWQIATGNMLYKFQCPTIDRNKFKDFIPYAADQQDNSYRRNSQNLKNHTRQLIVSKFYIDTPSEKNKPFQVLSNNPGQTDLLISTNETPRKTHKFYLLEMVTPFDNVDAGQDSKLMNGVNYQDEEVRIVFEFDFELLQDLSPAQEEKQGWNAIKEPTQHIYISANNEKLLEIVNRESVNIYRKGDSWDVDGHEKVFWRLESVVNRFSDLLQGEGSVNFLYSKNFNYYFDFDYDKNQLFINKTETQQHFVPIPNDMINFENEDGVKRKKEVKEVGKNITFCFGAKEERVRIINKDGVDCVFDFSEVGLRVISYAKIDNYQLMNSVHNIREESSIDDQNVLRRLIRREQRYKTNLIHEMKWKGINLKPTEADSRPNVVDYACEDWNATGAKFVPELSFTILNWKIIERVLSRDRFDLQDVDNPQLIQMIYCIFPKNQTVLHKLCAKKDLFGKSSMSDGVKLLFEIASGKSGESFFGYRKGNKFDVPFLLDANGCTPIDLALGINSRLEEAQEENTNFIDTELASLYLTQLKDQPFLNHGNLITRSIQSCIENEVQGVGDYLDSRFKHVVCMPAQVQNELRTEVTDELPGDISYGVVSTGPMISDLGVKKQAYLDSGMNFQYYNYMFDLPFLHMYTPDGVGFIKALNNYPSVTVFSHKSIQIICKYHWDTWNDAIYYLRLVPYTILLLCFLIWSNLVITYSHGIKSGEITLTPLQEVRYRRADIVLCWILIATSSFFMLDEAQAFIQSPKDYVKNFVENISDLVPLILLYVNTIWSLTRPGELALAFWVIQSITSIMLWMKFVWFLRSIHYFAYLIRSLVEAINDIRSFFVILIVTCIGFADAFLSLSRSLGKDGFVTNYYGAFRYTWLFVLGQNPGIENMNVYADILYFVASVYLLIILLNVLIAIAGNSLSVAQETKDENALKAKVELLESMMSHPIIQLIQFIRRNIETQREDDLLFISFKSDVFKEINEKPKEEK